MNNNKLYNSKVYDFICSKAFLNMPILIAMAKISTLFEIIFNTKLNGYMTDDLSWWDELNIDFQEAIIDIIDKEITDKSVKSFNDFVDNLKIHHLEKLVISHKM